MRICLKEKDKFSNLHFEHEKIRAVVLVCLDFSMVQLNRFLVVDEENRIDRKYRRNPMRFVMLREQSLEIDIRHLDVRWIDSIVCQPNSNDDRINHKIYSNHSTTDSKYSIPRKFYFELNQIVVLLENKFDHRTQFSSLHSHFDTFAWVSFDYQLCRCFAILEEQFSSNLWLHLVRKRWQCFEPRECRAKDWLDKQMLCNRIQIFKEPNEKERKSFTVRSVETKGTDRRTDLLDWQHPVAMLFQHDDRAMLVKLRQHSYTSHALIPIVVYLISKIEKIKSNFLWKRSKSNRAFDEKSNSPLTVGVGIESSKLDERVSDRAGRSVVE